MSLTSYRAAPSRITEQVLAREDDNVNGFGTPSKYYLDGNPRLFRGLQSLATTYSSIA